MPKTNPQEFHPGQPISGPFSIEALSAASRPALISDRIAKVLETTRRSWLLGLSAKV